MEIICPRCKRKAKLKECDCKQKERKRIILCFPCYHYSDLVYNVPQETDANAIMKDFISISREYFDKKYYLKHGNERFL